MFIFASYILINLTTIYSQLASLVTRMTKFHIHKFFLQRREKLNHRRQKVFSNQQLIRHK